jgi:hypothetical protein
MTNRRLIVIDLIFKGISDTQSRNECFQENLAFVLARAFASLLSDYFSSFCVLSLASFRHFPPSSGFGNRIFLAMLKHYICFLLAFKRFIQSTWNPSEENQWQTSEGLTSMNEQLSPAAELKKAVHGNILAKVPNFFQRIRMGTLKAAPHFWAIRRADSSCFGKSRHQISENSGESRIFPLLTST